MRVPGLILIVIAATGLSGLWWWRSRPVETKTISADITTPAVDPLGSTFDRPSLPAFNDLQARLGAMNSAEAVALIREFLKSGRDKPTGMPFETGPDHAMKQWPTFRAFLLDALLAIDPAAAAEISREILAKPTTADEWALALRNIGLTDPSPESMDLLKAKTEALISNPAWQAHPTAGYLNSFDALVHTGATETTPLLSSLIRRKDRKELVHAAFLTLDRLVQKAPADVLARLAADQELQQSRPEMVAQQFARADLRDPEQREITRNWLLDTARTGTELHAFAGVYPNNNRFVSDNLLSADPAPSGADLAAHDRAALEILNAWAADPAFAPVKDHLATMIARLKGFTASPDE